MSSACVTVCGWVAFGCFVLVSLLVLYVIFHLFNRSPMYLRYIPNTSTPVLGRSLSATSLQFLHRFVSPGSRLHFTPQRTFSKVKQAKTSAEPLSMSEKQKLQALQKLKMQSRVSKMDQIREVNNWMPAIAVFYFLK